MNKVACAVLLATVGSGVSLLLGCNNGSCDYVSKCPNDPAVTNDDRTGCDNKKNDAKCGGLYNDYLSCFQSNQACTTTGVTDLTVTNGTCGDQYAKWQDCYYGVDGSAYTDGGK